MNPLRISVLACAVALTACSTYVMPPIQPDEPAAEIHGTGGFSMTTPIVNEKGCYQGNLRIETRGAAQSLKVRAGRPLVVAIDGSIGPYACRSMVKFTPKDGHKYVAHGLVGTGDDDAERSIMGQLRSLVGRPTCGIAVQDETDGGAPVEVERTRPKQKSFACIRF